MMMSECHQRAYGGFPSPHTPLVSAPAWRTLLLTAAPADSPAAVAALAGELQQRSSAVHTVDFWSLPDERIVEAVSAINTRLSRDQPAFYAELCRRDQRNWEALMGDNPLPPLTFDASAYESGAGGLLERSLLMAWQAAAVVAGTPEPVWQGLRVWVRSLLLGRLTTLLSQYEPDMVIVTQAPCASLLAALKVGPLRHVPLFGVVPLGVVGSEWSRLALDGYCVADEMTATQLRAQGVPARHIHVTGQPWSDACGSPARIAALVARRLKSACSACASVCLS